MRKISDVIIEADLTVDTNVLHVDSTNNRVGIGTASPSNEILHVAGNIMMDGSILRMASSTTKLVLQNVGGSWNSLSAKGINIGDWSTDPSYGDIRVGDYDFDIIRTDGTHLIKAKNNGNVLIGTTTDAGHKLNVNGGAAADYFQLDTAATPTPAQGMFYWDPDEETAGLQVNGLNYELGQGLYWVAKNQTGSQIDKGTPVYASGTLGSSTRLLISPMIADGTIEAKYFLGLAAEDIANGADGKVITQGKLRQLDTSGYGAAGNVLWVSASTAGELTHIKPTGSGDIALAVAFVVHYASNGSIAARVSNLDENIVGVISTLDQVTTAGNTTTNDIEVGGLNVDSGTLYVDSTNNRVGIGTASPSAKLHVTGLLIANGGQIRSGSYLETYPSFSFVNDTDTGMFSDTANQLEFSTGGSSRMAITSGGNVLIGTTTDNGYKLNVNGDATINGVRVGLGNNGLSQNTVVGNGGFNAITTGNSNTALGYYAGNSNTSGSNNTAIGRMAGRYTTTSSNNTSLGYNALYYNESGSNNTAVGLAALLYNTTGNNTAIGANAAQNNTTGSIVAVGYQAGYSNTTGTEITAIGREALKNSTGTGHTVVGYNSALSTTTGTNNSTLGAYALRLNTTGSNNVAIGKNTLYNNTASYNTAVGKDAAFSNTTGSIVALGYEAGYSQTTGTSTTAIGHQSLRDNTASGNTGVGFESGRFTTTGSVTALGFQAARNNSTGVDITSVGYQAARNNTASYVTAVGHQAAYNNTTASTTTAIGRRSVYNNATGGYNVGVGINTLVNTTAGNNTAIGSYAGDSNTTGSNNIFIGKDSDGVAATDSNRTFIGNSSTTSTWVGGNLLVGTTTDAGTWKTRIQGQYPLQLLNSSGTAKFEFYADSNEHRYLNGAKIVGHNQDLSIDTNSSSYDILLAQNGGSVGIGTTSPSKKLEIVASDSDGIRVSGGTNGRYVEVTSSNLDFYTTSTSGYGMANLVRKNSDGSVLGQISGAFGDPNTLTYTYYGGTAYNNAAMYILSSNNNVGIGTASPGSPLHIAGSGLDTSAGAVGVHLGVHSSTYAGIEMVASGSADGWIDFSNTNSANDYNERIRGGSGLFQFYTSGAERMRITSGGNVLIGTTTDSGEKLYVNGNTRVDGNLYVASDIIHTGDTDTKIQFNTDIINFDTAGVERLRITAGGNVGIGTSSPAYNLDVTGELRATSVLRANSNAIVGGYLDLTGDFFHRDDIKVLNKAANNWLIWAQRDTAASEVVVDLNYIGTITPGSDSAYDIGSNTVRFANGYFDTLYGDGSNLTGITATETDTLDSVTSRGSTTSNAIGVGGLNVDSGTLYVDSTNNRVGIGTTAPASTLMVHSTGSTAVGKQWQTIISDNNTLAADRGGGIIFRGRYSGTQPANFCGIRAGKLNSTNGDANAYLSLLYGAAGTMTEGIRVNYNGNVLIGTTTDSGYKLEVNGDINTSGDYYAGGTQGYTGTVTINQPSPQPPINIDIQGGIITNVY